MNRLDPVQYKAFFVEHNKTTDVFKPRGFAALGQLRFPHFELFYDHCVEVPWCMTAHRNSILATFVCLECESVD